MSKKLVTTKKKYKFEYTLKDPNKPYNPDKNHKDYNEVVGCPHPHYIVFKRAVDGEEVVIQFPWITGKDRVKMLNNEHPDVEVSKEDLFDKDDISWFIDYAELDLTLHNVQIPRILMAGYGGRGFPLLKAKRIIDEKNAETRTALIREFTFDRFIREGGGKCVLNPKKGDYQHASIWSVPFGGRRGREISFQFVKLINRTVEPGSEKLTEQQRMDSGLTKEGYKIYVETLPQTVDKWPSAAYARMYGNGQLNEKMQPERLSEESIMRSSDRITKEQAKAIADKVYETNQWIKEKADWHYKTGTPYDIEVES